MNFPLPVAPGSGTTPCVRRLARRGAVRAYVHALVSLAWLFAGFEDAVAQSAGRLDPVVVTATRFGDPEISTSANVIVLTREEIEASGAQTLPDALRLIAAVHVMPLYGALGIDTAVDMRGFGEGANTRTLVLLDGLRLNPIDTDSVDWGLVPLEAVDRIEVISGSATVLYGDNAVGGVINIITDQQRTGDSVQMGVGSHGSRLLAARAARQQGAVAATLSVVRQMTDGWRDNNRQERSSAAVRLTMELERGEAFVALGASETNAGLPGKLSREQYRSNPRQAETPDSFFSRTALYLRPGLRWKLGDQVDFAVETGRTELRKTAWFSNWFPEGYDERNSSTASFTPRLQWGHRLGGVPSRTIVGLDHYDGELASEKSNQNAAPVVRKVQIGQLSEAVYLQNQTVIRPGLTFTAGTRRQHLGQTVRDSLGQAAVQSHDRIVGDIGLNWRAAPAVRVFARTGSNFRFASLDELTTWTGFVTRPVRPERGAYADIGTQWNGKGASLIATAYRLDMVDEIAYNAVTQENENLARTRRHGLDLSSRIDLSRQWRAQAGVALVDARFTDGTDNGRRVPLVPRYRFTAGLTHLPIQSVSLSLLALQVADRYAGSDTANMQPMLEAYTTFDLVANWRVEGWTLRGRVANLTDQRYSPTGFAGPGFSGFYPADGRSMFIDLRRDL